jgi:predicted nuclease of predicted toxin-antitoxin system
MKFLCDVHISYKIVNFLNSFGHETIHVNQILDKWHSKDKDICNYADINDFVIISKDYDFRDSYFIKKTPKKLIKINLGNISNQELMDILSVNLDSFEKLNREKSFIIEIDKNNITFLK